MVDRARLSLRGLRQSLVPDQADAILSFWAWWPTVADGIARGFSSKLPPEIIAELSERVGAIDPSLDWEFGPGLRAQHHLCLSAKGDPVLRVAAERWLRRAPPADATWEFHASRQASSLEGLTLDIAEHSVELMDVMVAPALDEAREVFDVRLYHPIFERIADEDLRAQIVFIALDNFFGEDGVERWIGAVDVVPALPEGAVPLAELKRSVAEFSARATGEKFVVLRGEREGSPLFVTFNAACKRVDHLLLDMHVAIDIELASPTPEGLTTTAEAEALDAMEDDLLRALGAEAVYIGRETGEGHRTLHLHVMEGGPSAALLERWTRRYPAYSIALSVAPDPRWDILDRWR